MNYEKMNENTNFAIFSTRRRVVPSINEQPSAELAEW
jgi:hypothetical protein